MGSSQLPSDGRVDLCVHNDVADIGVIAVELRLSLYAGYDFYDRSYGIFQWAETIHEEIVHREESLCEYLPDHEYLLGAVVLADSTEIHLEYRVLHLRVECCAVLFLQHNCSELAND